MSIRIISQVILLVILSSITASSKKLTVPTDIKTIQACIDKADEGDTVFVKKGIYRETITLKDMVSLIGESTSQTIINGSGDGVVVTGADKALLSGFTIENGNVGIRCSNVIPTIENVIVRSNKETGIHCIVALPEIRNTVVYRNNWTGIFVESARSIKSSIQHCVIAENGYCGIMLENRSEVLIQNNMIYDNKQYGVWADIESVRSRIVYNNIYGNREAYNYFAKADKSNISEFPDYPLLGKLRSYTESPLALKGKGKNGSTIGIIDKKELEQLNEPKDIIIPTK